MSRIAQSTFVANTNSLLVFGRALTEAEITTLANIKVTAIGEGHHVSPNVFDDATGTLQNYWDDLASAEAYASAAGGFTPAPTSVTVSAV